MAQPKENAVKFGISNAHVAFIKDDGKTYEEPIHVPGTVNISLDPEGDTTTKSADNRSYYVTTSNKGYTGSTETVGWPDSVLAKALGQYIDKHGGVVETGSDRPCPFALGGEIDGDPLQRRFWFYKTTLGRPSMNAQTTEDTVEVADDTYDLTITSIDADDWPNLIKYAVPSDSDAFEGFFDAVCFPERGEYAPDVPATSVELSEKALTIAAPGTGSKTAAVTVTPSGATDPVEASSNDPSVADASYEDGTLTVTGKGKAGSCAVTVSCGEAVAALAVTVQTA